MSLNPYESPDTASEPPERKRGVFTLVELLVVIGLIVILIGLFLPAVRVAREPARRSQCSNNLKQIALALHMYADEHGEFPPAYTVDEQGKPLHSWRTLILPYLEQKALYDKIDLTKPWDDPANKAALETDVQIYRCPSTDFPANHTTYLAIAVPGGFFQATQPRAMADVADDKDLTLMVVEVDAERAVHWMSPLDADEKLYLGLASAAQPPHQGGVQAATASGAVRYLPKDLDAATRRALISIAGHDDALAGRAD